MMPPDIQIYPFDEPAWNGRPARMGYYVYSMSYWGDSAGCEGTTETLADALILARAVAARQNGVLDLHMGALFRHETRRLGLDRLEECRCVACEGGGDGA